MDAQKVDMFIMSNGKFFEDHQMNMIRERLIVLDVSILAGSIGVDRFMIGDTGIGVGKLLTCGGLGIWTIIDLFLIQKATKEKNMQKILQYLH
jgi:TM2 domain-containing membrane protein YozV